MRVDCGQGNGVMTDAIEILREAGKPTVADEKRFCKLDAAMMKHGNDALRRIMMPVVKEQKRHCEAARG